MVKITELKSFILEHFIAIVMSLCTVNVLEFVIYVLEKGIIFSIVLELSWKSTPKCPGMVRKMSWNVLESPGILILKCCGHHAISN